MQTKQFSKKNKHKKEHQKNYTSSRKQTKTHCKTNRKTYKNTTKLLQHLPSMKGGKLLDKKLKEYQHKLRILYETDYKPNKHKILHELLIIGYEEAQKTLQSYIDKFDDPSKNEMMLELQKILNNLNMDVSKIKYENLDIPEFNIRSLQLVILFTELERLTNSNTKETSMLGYFQQPRFPIDEYYNELVSDKLWIDLKALQDKIIELEPKSRIFQSYKFLTLLGYYDKYSRNPDIKYHTLENINERVQIIVYLDYLSLQDIIISYANNVYLIGITESMTWADGRYLTPFEFLHHDITHSLNREMGYNTGKNTLEFMTYINNLKNTGDIGEKEIYELKVILFILVHESRFESILDNTIESTFKSYSDICGGTTFLCNWDNWRNDNYFGGLLGQYLMNEKGISKTDYKKFTDEEKAKQLQSLTDDELKEYLDRIFNNFFNKWNQFYKLKQATS
jgi:hypothetical protein